MYRFVATALISKGSLKTGSHIVSGLHYAKVRRMTDSTGKVVSVATPGMAVTVSGWKTLPKAGDNVIEGAESDVKKAIANRIRQSEIEASLADVDAINETRRVERELRAAEAETKNRRSSPQSKTQVVEGSGPKELRIIIKADVSGSAEAVEGALQGIGNKIAISKIISAGVGEVSESDVTLAQTADGNVRTFWSRHALL
jgi:translation initiation factor IF-2